jgi:negative regulator of flagellin synthesis FlgM
MNIGNGVEGLSQTSIQRNEGVHETAPNQNATRVAAATTEGASAGQSDQATLSVSGTQLAASTATSDVRLEKVASIQAALQAGTYKVPASAVAQKLVDSLLEESK